MPLLSYHARRTRHRERRELRTRSSRPRRPVSNFSSFCSPVGSIGGPNLNADAERFVRSVKSECLRHIVPMGEQHLRAVVREYVEHYNHERNHQGLDNVIPLPLEQTGKGAIRRHELLIGTSASRVSGCGGNSASRQPLRPLRHLRPDGRQRRPASKFGHGDIEPFRIPDGRSTRLPKQR
jgi:hypothetical protein